MFCSKVIIKAINCSYSILQSIPSVSLGMCVVFYRVFHQPTSVPAANLSNSKTPMGPFQMTVLVVSKDSLNVLMESGPMSSPIQPSGMEDAGTTCTQTKGKKGEGNLLLSS